MIDRVLKQVVCPTSESAREGRAYYIKAIRMRPCRRAGASFCRETPRKGSVGILPAPRCASKRRSGSPTIREARCSLCELTRCGHPSREQARRLFYLSAKAHVRQDCLKTERSFRPQRTENGISDVIFEKDLMHSPASLLHGNLTNFLRPTR